MGKTNQKEEAAFFNQYFPYPTLLPKIPELFEVTMAHTNIKL